MMPRSNVHPIHTEADGLEGWVEVDLGDGAINVDQTPGPRRVSDRQHEIGERPGGSRDAPAHRLRRYPTITGDLKAMKQTDNAARYMVRGDLTFRGQPARTRTR